MISKLIHWIVQLAFMVSGTYAFYQLTFDFKKLAYMETKSGLVSLSKWNRALMSPPKKPAHKARALSN